MKLNGEGKEKERDYVYREIRVYENEEEQRTTEGRPRIGEGTDER